MRDDLPGLLERGRLLTPPPNHADGSERMLIGLGVALCHRMSVANLDKPTARVQSQLVEAVRTSLDLPSGNVRAEQMRRLMGDFVERAEKLKSKLENTKGYAATARLADELTAGMGKAPGKGRKSAAKGGEYRAVVIDARGDGVLHTLLNRRPCNKEVVEDGVVLMWVESEDVEEAIDMVAGRWGLWLACTIPWVRAREGAWEQVGVCVVGFKDHKPLRQEVAKALASAVVTQHGEDPGPAWKGFLELIEKHHPGPKLPIGFTAEGWADMPGA